MCVCVWGGFGGCLCYGSRYSWRYSNIISFYCFFFFLFMVKQVNDDMKLKPQGALDSLRSSTSLCVLRQLDPRTTVTMPMSAWPKSNLPDSSSSHFLFQETQGLPTVKHDTSYSQRVGLNWYYQIAICMWMIVCDVTEKMHHSDLACWSHKTIMLDGERAWPILMLSYAHMLWCRRIILINFNAQCLKFMQSKFEVCISTVNREPCWDTTL